MKKYEHMRISTSGCPDTETNRLIKEHEPDGWHLASANDYGVHTVLIFKREIVEPTLVCDKALKRLRDIKNKNECIKWDICPKCGAGLKKGPFERTHGFWTKAKCVKCDFSEVSPAAE